MDIVINLNLMTEETVLTTKYQWMAYTLPKYERQMAGTTNPRGTRKPDNPLQGIWNAIPQDPDNPLKGIRDLVQNGTRSQWPRGLTIPT